MNILIIDSHKGKLNRNVTNLHVRNARILSLILHADLVGSHEGNDYIYNKKYDVIIFNHASKYSNIDIKILYNNPEAKLFYITNEYNLGEPLLLWKYVKEKNKKYDVIANHEQSASKVTNIYINKWNILNLNSLIYNWQPRVSLDFDDIFGVENRFGVIYYGSYRDNRTKYFMKYFDERMVVSTSKKNKFKFLPYTNGCQFRDKLKWYPYISLRNYKASLYIEDEKTHDNYNFLSNRFYEGLMCDTPVIFDESCRNTINKSGYVVPESLICKDSNDLHNKLNDIKIPIDWYDKAKQEKANVVEKIKEIVCLRN